MTFISLKIPEKSFMTNTFYDLFRHIYMSPDSHLKNVLNRDELRPELRLKQELSITMGMHQIGEEALALS